METKELRDALFLINEAQMALREIPVSVYNHHKMQIEDAEMELGNLEWKIVGCLKRRGADTPVVELADDGGHTQ